MSESQDRIEREIQKRREKGEPFAPVEVHRKKSISGSFWGQLWCRNLETYSDYEFLLPAGRRYLRSGHVYDLEIETGEVFAYVTGAEIYEVIIRIDSLEEGCWEEIKASCTGKIDTLVDLLSGNLGDQVLEVVTDPELGLFPSTGEIHFSCTCPDWADMCKHVAATMYGIGVLLDDRPELFFQLRGVEKSELLEGALDGATNFGSASLATNCGELTPGSLSEIFGIEISDPESAFLNL